MWVGGVLLAAVLVIFGVLFAVDIFLNVHDPNDPLERAGGLMPDQEIRQKK